MENPTVSLSIQKGTLICLTLFVAFLAPCPGGEENLDEYSAGIALGGPEILATIKGATSVTAQRVDSIFDDDPSVPLHERVEQELKILGEPLEVPAPLAAELKQLFGDGATYLAASKRCRFRANVRYAFAEAEKVPVKIVMCFGCGQLEVWQKGELISFSPFDARYGELLKLAQQIFPNDAFLAEFDPAVFERRAAEMRQ